MIDKAPSPDQTEEAKWQAAQYFLGQCGVEGNLGAVFERLRTLKWELDFNPLNQYLNFTEPSTGNVPPRIVHFRAHTKTGKESELEAEVYWEGVNLETHLSDNYILKVEGIGIEHYGQTFDLVIRGRHEDIEENLSIDHALIVGLSDKGIPGGLRITQDIMAKPELSLESS